MAAEPQLAAPRDGPGVDAELRLAALRVGLWLGWLSVTAVLVAIALGLDADHVGALLGLTLVAAIANGIVAALPRSWWNAPGRGDRMLTAWSAGLVVLVPVLVVVSGGRADLDLLGFLVLPFLATVHTGGRRIAWLAVALVALVAATVLAPAPLSAGETALRAGLLVAAAALALALGQLTRRAAHARAELAARAKLEHDLLAEAHHRVKNSLQTVSDLLLLGRPAGADGLVFDETADRIRAIAVVHRLLSEERGAHVDAAALLTLIADGVAPGTEVRAAHVPLHPTCAQHLGVVANELVANAVRHGASPITVELRADDELELIVRDAGGGPLPAADASGLGLRLVARVVGDGLRGTFALSRTPDGATEARVRFDPEGACAS